MEWTSTKWAALWIHLFLKRKRKWQYSLDKSPQLIENSNTKNWDWRLNKNTCLNNRCASGNKIKRGIRRSVIRILPTAEGRGQEKLRMVGPSVCVRRITVLPSRAYSIITRDCKETEKQFVSCTLGSNKADSNCKYRLIACGCSTFSDEMLKWNVFRNFINSLSA